MKIFFLTILLSALLNAPTGVTEAAPDGSKPTEAVTLELRRIYSEVMLKPDGVEFRAFQRRIAEYQESGGDIRDVVPEMNVPINFYGKVIDEKGNAIPGVKVVFIWLGWSSEERPKLETISDAQGHFSLTNAVGAGIMVSVSREGYYIPIPHVKTFEYGNKQDPEFHRPNAAEPVLFHLKKKGKAEPLIAIDFPGLADWSKIARDGVPVEIDLMKGAIAPAGQGQLKIEFTSVPYKRGEPFDWSCRLTIVGGGLVARKEPLDFAAPEKGYEPFVQITNRPVNLNEPRISALERSYFFKLEDGKFGRFYFFLHLHKAFFKVESFINPTGSRNLEFDEAVQPRPTRFE